jgi:hypothetical protein
MPPLAGVRMVVRATSTRSGEPHCHETEDRRRKLSVLDLASDLGNVSNACKVIGYSRQIRRNFQTYGAVGTIPGVRTRAAA